MFHEAQGIVAVSVGAIAALVTLVIIGLWFKDQSKYQDQNSDEH